MANTKSAAKAARVTERRRVANRARKTAVKTLEKRVRTAVAEGKKDEAIKLLPDFQSEIDRAARKGTIHKNSAGRHKSRVAALIGKMS